MQDPKWINPAEIAKTDPTRYAISDEQKKVYRAEPLSALPKRVDDAHDKIRWARKDSDDKYADLNRRLNFEKRKTRMLMAILGAAAYKGLEVGAIWLFAFLGKMAR